METTISCSYCNLILSDKSALCRHINHYCRSVPPEVKAALLEKQQRRKKKSKLIPVENNISIKGDTTTTNNIQINLINICGNDVPEEVIKSIKELNESAMDKLREYIPNLLQPFGSEDLSQLTEDSKKIIKYFNNVPSETFKNLLNDIHKIDENRNFAVPNVKYAIVQFVNNDYDISKSSKQDHIRDIQIQMKNVYYNLLKKYRLEIRKKYFEKHEQFLKNMLRMYDDILGEFRAEVLKAKEEEICRLKRIAEENDEVFDDRSINERPEPECHIPDYNRITREIIETYLTTNSRINVECLKQHKDKVVAIKSAIGFKPKRKIVRLCDLEEENRLADKKEKATQKVYEMMDKSSSNNISRSKDLSLMISYPELDEDKLLTELEEARGAD